MLLKTLTVLILAMPLFSSTEEPKKVKLHNSVRPMKEEVLKRIPLESSIEHAMYVMQVSGFKCEMLWNKPFADYDDQGNQTTREEMNFLYCDKEKAAFPYICTRRWQIGIVHKNRAVSEVLVSIGLGCP